MAYEGAFLMGSHRARARRLERELSMQAFKDYRSEMRGLSVDPLLWLLHFHGIRPSEATCFDCADFLSGVCTGGI